jgi:spore maturation protein SpmA
MTEKLWIPLTAIALIVVIEVGQSIAREGFRNYCCSWVETLMRGATRVGLLKRYQNVEKPVKRRILKDIKDL